MAGETTSGRILSNILAILPEKFRCKLLKIGQKSPDWTEFSCQLSAQMTTLEETREFVDSFGEGTDTNWIIQKTTRSRKDERSLTMALFNCQLASTNKSKQTTRPSTSRDYKCESRANFTINALLVSRKIRRIKIVRIIGQH